MTGSRPPKLGGLQPGSIPTDDHNFGISIGQPVQFPQNIPGISPIHIPTLLDYWRWKIHREVGLYPSLDSINGFDDLVKLEPTKLVGYYLLGVGIIPKVKFMISFRLQGRMYWKLGQRNYFKRNKNCFFNIPYCRGRSNWIHVLNYRSTSSPKRNLMKIKICKLSRKRSIEMSTEEELKTN